MDTTFNLNPKLQRTAGIDVHTSKMNVCVMDSDGKCEFKVFGTYTSDLFLLRDWLLSCQVRDVVLESTGIYWLPLYTILEQSKFCITLANPLQVKQIPGRKTDTADSQWLSQLLMYGLVRGSFVPGDVQRSLRNLNRYRYHYIQDQGQTKAKIVTLLESCNFKLREVLSNINTVSARNICSMISHGEKDVEQLCKGLRGKARKKTTEMKEALQGVISKEQQFALTLLLMDWAHLEKQVESLENEMERLIAIHYKESFELLCSLPGIASSSARAVLAEIGDAITAFKDADHLTAWAGLAPANKQSGTKWYSQPTRKGNKYLMTIMIQIAWAAVRVKNGYWQAHFLWLKKRMPSKKALVAIARKFLKLIYRTLQRRVFYEEKGGNYFLERFTFFRKRPLTST
jgi:transposase